jgi:hypothetical protein
MAAVIRLRDQIRMRLPPAALRRANAFVASWAPKPEQSPGQSAVANVEMQLIPDL